MAPTVVAMGYLPQPFSNWEDGVLQSQILSETLEISFCCCFVTHSFTFSDTVVHLGNQKVWSCLPNQDPLCTLVSGPWLIGGGTGALGGRALLLFSLPHILVIYLGGNYLG